MLCNRITIPSVRAAVQYINRINIEWKNTCTKMWKMQINSTHNTHCNHLSIMDDHVSSNAYSCRIKSWQQRYVFEKWGNRNAVHTFLKNVLSSCVQYLSEQMESSELQIYNSNVFIDALSLFIRSTSVWLSMPCDTGVSYSRKHSLMQTCNCALQVHVRYCRYCSDTIPRNRRFKEHTDNRQNDKRR